MVEGKRGALIGLVGNAIIFALTIVTGVVGGSFGLIAAALHTLSDFMASAVVYLGFHVAAKPPDEEHHYGHGDAEALAGLIVAALILVIGYEVGRGSFGRVLGPHLTAPAPIAYLGAVVATAGNSLTAYLQGSIARRIRSPSLLADTEHNKSDALASGIVLIGVVAARAGYPVFDPLAGFIVALFILKTGFDVGRENIDLLMGKITDPELVKDLERMALGIEGVEGVHSIKIRYIGPMAYVQMHVEVDRDMRLIDADRIAHRVQAKLVSGSEAVREALVHVCPWKGSRDV